MKNQKRVSTLIGVVIIVAIAVIAFGGIFAYQYFSIKNQQQKITACTQEAKVCPDGSAVGRTGSNCEFAQCPVVNQCTIDSDCPSLLVECDPNYCPDGRGKCVDGKCTTQNADWKTYTNNEHGFEFKYPASWSFGEDMAFALKSGKKFLVRYISKEQNSAPSITYCNANPKNIRCEIVKLNGNAIVNIDWQSGGEKVAYITIEALDGGRIELYVTNFVDTEKAIVLQILSTFKFTK